MHPSDRDEVDARFRRALAARGHLDHQYRIIHAADKSERWVHSKARIDYFPNGTPQRMVGIVRDVTVPGSLSNIAWPRSNATSVSATP